jgi:hypothetical protein
VVRSSAASDVYKRQNVRSSNLLTSTILYGRRLRGVSFKWEPA